MVESRNLRFLRKSAHLSRIWLESRKVASWRESRVEKGSARPAAGEGCGDLGEAPARVARLGEPGRGVWRGLPRGPKTGPKTGPKRGRKSARFPARARAGKPGVFFPRFRARAESAIFHFSRKPAVATLKKTFFWFSCFSQLPQDSPGKREKQRKPATNGGRILRQKTENPRFPPRRTFSKPGKAQSAFFANRLLKQVKSRPISSLLAELAKK